MIVSKSIMEKETPGNKIFEKKIISETIHINAICAKTTIDKSLKGALSICEQKLNLCTKNHQILLFFSI